MPLLQIVCNSRRSQQRAVVRKKSVKAASTAAQPCVLACDLLICAGSFAVAAPRPWSRMPPSLISGASKTRRRHAVITFPSPFSGPLFPSPSSPALLCSARLMSCSSATIRHWRASVYHRQPGPAARWPMWVPCPALFCLSYPLRRNGSYPPSPATDNWVQLSKSACKS